MLTFRLVKPKKWPIGRIYNYLFWYLQKKNTYKVVCNNKVTEECIN
jgi:hypothetical protein